MREKEDKKLEEERFFAELFVRPPSLDYAYHPSDEVLRSYLRGELHDEWQFDEDFLPQLRRADLNGGWGLSEVSLHLLTCKFCCERIARFRAEELAELRRARGWRARVQGFLTRLCRWLANALAIGLSPVALDLSLGSGPAPAVSQALLYQYARNGIELQSSLLPWELGARELENEEDY